MSIPLGALELRYASGDSTASLSITRAQLAGFNEEYDLRAVRAPFGETSRAVGTGRRLPTIVNVSGTLEGATQAASEELLATLKTALRSPTAIRVQNLELPILNATGPLVATPTLRGWRCAFQLETTDDWEQLFL